MTEDPTKNKKRDGAKVFKGFTELHFGVLFAQQAIASAQTGNSCWLVAGYTTNFHGYFYYNHRNAKVPELPHSTSWSILRKRLL